MNSSLFMFYGLSIIARLCIIISTNDVLYFELLGLLPFLDPYLSWPFFEEDLFCLPFDFFTVSRVASKSSVIMSLLMRVHIFSNVSWSYSFYENLQ